ncbi:hypothetical protein Taro_015242, partial [Colocasia esculenta]|nr:hypothetical protein [Colocasia esculenta]
GVEGEREAETAARLRKRSWWRGRRGRRWRPAGLVGATAAGDSGSGGGSRRSRSRGRSSAAAAMAGKAASNMASRETEATPLEGSDQGSKKASNGSLGNGGLGDGNKVHSSSVNTDPLGNAGFLTKGCGNGDKATSGSVNVDPSLSCTISDESGGEEFSRNSRDDEINPCDLSISGTRSCDQMFPDLVVSAPLKVAPNLPATNKGVGLWNHSQVNGGQNTVVKLNLILTKKECEDLSMQVAELNTQNGDLRAEIDQLNMECKKLEAENASIVEELKQLYGPSVLAATEGEEQSMSAIRILGVECNGHGPERGNLVPMVYQNVITLPPSNGEGQ